MRSTLLHVLQIAALGSTLAFAAACGGPPGPAAPTTPAQAAAVATPNTTPAAAPTAEVALPTSWSKDMTKDQQMAFMKKNILPAMGPVFQAHDATKYADFSCKTCHGPEYKNPHDYLPKLTMKDGKMTAFAEKPEIAKFMVESVSPKMADAMGLPHFDMKTHQGFGCGGCHTVEMK
jgi:hypothetical protein